MKRHAFTDSLRRFDETVPAAPDIVAYRLSNCYNCVLPYSGKFSRAQIFANHQQIRQENNFTIFIFATRSRYLTTPPTIPRKEMATHSVYFNVKTTVRGKDAYQSVSVAVGEELPCQREGANSEDLFAVAVMTGELS